MNYRILDNDTGIYHSVMVENISGLDDIRDASITNFTYMTEVEYEQTDHFKSIMSDKIDSDIKTQMCLLERSQLRAMRELFLGIPQTQDDIDAITLIVQTIDDEITVLRGNLTK